MNALVTGATGGLGKALVRTLLTRPSVKKVFACARRPDRLGIEDPDRRVVPMGLELTEMASIEHAARQVRAQTDHLDVVVHAAGILHDEETGLRPEKRLEQLTASNLAQSFAINAHGPFLLTRELLPLLVRQTATVAERASGHAERPVTIVMVSARVGSVEDNHLGGWYAYRASKAAQNQLTRTLAIELKRRRPSARVIAYHPGTLETRLSAPFRRDDRPGVLSPQEAAERLLSPVDALQPSDTGQFYAWDGSLIPW